MARYRKIDPRIWNDEKFNALSDKGKLAYFNLLTHPHLTMLGAMRASIPGLACELGWSAEGLREALSKALSEGMVKHDEKASFFWLPNFLKYNQPESPNVVKSWGQALDYLPECDLKNQLIQYVNSYIKGFSQAFQEALPKALLKTSLNQEQKQEQEQINIRKVETLPGSVSESTQSAEVTEIFQYWQSVMNHPRAKLDNHRKRSVGKALKLGYSKEDLKKAVEGCAKTPFNMGENDRHQRYDELSLILRDAEHIEKFIQNAESPPQPTLANKPGQATNKVFEGVI